MEDESEEEEEEENTPKLFDDFPQTDLALIVEGQKLHVNKEVLKYHSPVFNRMFEGDFKEKDAKELELAGKSFDDVKVFLRSFYPNMEHPINEKNVLQVFPLAHEYQMPLQHRCEEILLEKASSFCCNESNAYILIKYMCLAEKFSMENLLKTAILTASQTSFTRYLQTKANIQEYSLLSQRTRLLIAERRVKILEQKNPRH